MSITFVSIRSVVPDGDADPDASWTITALRDGLAVGMVGMTINRLPAETEGAERKPMCGWIYRVFVDEATRGQGVGSALLSAAIRTAREDGCTTLGLTVTHDNPARRLYERVGFVACWPADEKMIAYLLPSLDAATAA